MLYYILESPYQSPIPVTIQKLTPFAAISHGNYVQDQGGQFGGGIRDLGDCVGIAQLRQPCSRLYLPIPPISVYIYVFIKFLYNSCSH